MKKLFAAPLSLLLATSCVTSAVDTSVIEGDITAPPCADDYSFMTPDVKSLQWIAAGDAQQYLNEIEGEYQKKFGRLDTKAQLRLAAAVSGLMASANIDAVTTAKPVGIENMTDGKFNNIMTTKEYRGAAHVFPMKVTCDGTTNLIKAFDYKKPFTSKGYTPLSPIGTRIGVKAYTEGEVHPTNNYAKIVAGGVGKKSVTVEVKVWARLSKPFSNLNAILTKVKGVPWIQNWVQVTATCGDPTTNRVEAQFTKMPTSALWVDDALAQSHGQDDLGDFIINHPNVLAPLHTKFDKTYEVDFDDVCAGTTMCGDYTTSFDHCPVIDTSTPSVSGGSGNPCSQPFTTTSSSLGSSYEGLCFTNEDGAGDYLDVLCRAGLTWNGSECANVETGCVDRCASDGGQCWLYEDGNTYTCAEAADGCFDFTACTPGGPGPIDPGGPGPIDPGGLGPIDPGGPILVGF